VTGRNQPSAAKLEARVQVSNPRPHSRSHLVHEDLDQLPHDAGDGQQALRGAAGGDVGDHGDGDGRALGEEIAVACGGVRWVGRWVIRMRST
jgi:hypothetical protein